MGAKPERSEKPDNKYVIHIDRKKYDVEGFQLTGAEIRRLAGLGEDVDLYLEEHGDEDDRLIADSDPVDLQNGLHFFSAPKYIDPGRV